MRWVVKEEQSAAIEVLKGLDVREMQLCLDGIQKQEQLLSQKRGYNVKEMEKLKSQAENIIKVIDQRMNDVSYDQIDSLFSNRDGMKSVIALQNLLKIRDELIRFLPDVRLENEQEVTEKRNYFENKVSLSNYIVHIVKFKSNSVERISNSEKFLLDEFFLRDDLELDDVDSSTLVLAARITLEGAEVSLSQSPNIVEKTYAPNEEKAQVVFDEIASALLAYYGKEGAQPEETSKIIGELVESLKKDENISVRESILKVLQEPEYNLPTRVMLRIVQQIYPGSELATQLQKKEGYNFFMARDMKFSDVQLEFLLPWAKEAAKGTQFMPFPGMKMKPSLAKVNKFYGEIAIRSVASDSSEQTKKTIKDFLNNQDNSLIKEKVDDILKVKYEKLQSVVNQYLGELENEYQTERGKLRDRNDGPQTGISLSGTELNKSDLDSMKAAGSIDDTFISNLQIAKNKIAAVEVLKKTLEILGDENIDYAQKINDFSNALKNKSISIKKYSSESGEFIDAEESIKDIIEQNRDTFADKFLKEVDSVFGTKFFHSTYAHYFRPASKGAKAVESSEEIAEVKHEEQKPNR